jgi:hypothetical protein
MKKRKIASFFILLFLSSGFYLKAQESESSSGMPISFGAKVGGAFSGFTNHEEVFTSMRGGFTLGAFAEYKVNSIVGVAAELNYVQEGAFHVNPMLIYPASTVNYTESIYKTSSDIRLHTLQIPVLVNIRAPYISGNAVPKLILGYSFDFIMKAKSKDMYMISDPTGLPLEQRSNETVSSSFKDFNMGPVLGLGVDFKGDKFTYIFEARYKIGIKDINNLGSLNIYNSQYDFSVNTLTVTLGIGF